MLINLCKIQQMEMLRNDAQLFLLNPAQVLGNSPRICEMLLYEARLPSDVFKSIQPILHELINSERIYVASLYNGITKYANIFERQDLPLGLRGKKYDLIGNIEQIAEFHRDEFLPMLITNQGQLKFLFDKFLRLVNQNCFYSYVIFTMNKKKSQKLCENFKNFFKTLQVELNDKLGINSFLVQPIQRIAKYPLMLKEFMSILFENRENNVLKPLIASCCRLERKIRTLLTNANESEVVNDIVHCLEFNVFYQGMLHKVDEFTIYDHTLKRSYPAKLFIFDKSVIYTEIKEDKLIFHGRYPCEHIGIITEKKGFTLFYQRRKQQECDINGDAVVVQIWNELIYDMVRESRVDVGKSIHESDYVPRKSLSLSLFRDSNRFSSDSGIGNIWVMPRPEVSEVAQSNRSTWYAPF